MSAVYEYIKKFVIMARFVMIRGKNLQFKVFVLESAMNLSPVDNGEICTALCFYRDSYCFVDAYIIQSYKVLYCESFEKCTFKFILYLLEMSIVKHFFFNNSRLFYK